MRCKAGWTWLVGASLLLAGCYVRNLPPADQALPLVEAEIPTARVIVDAEGSFFPERWRPSRLGPFEVWNAGTLLGEAERRPELRGLLASERRRQLAALRAFLAGKKRVFVFIHGFDNNQRDTELPYGMLAQRIAFEPGDALILFHWDGFDGRMIGAPIHFWQAASTNSQMAGTRGLRPVLDLIGPDQQAILISHSRGGTVVLSALSNPRYSPGFVTRTRRLPYAASEHLLDPPPLLPGARNIHAVMLGAAMGRIDFVVADCPPGTERIGRRRCNEVRAFSRLASIDYTVNPCDEVLNKYVGLSRTFNPTDFGLSADVGRRLAPELAAQGIALRQHRVVPHGHIFPLYAADPILIEMMGALGVAARPWPTPPPTKTCRRARADAPR
ncbi:MAG TPA: alpha/beta hydrolase [Allosphingosinicella sp.]|nr:alpha/beta hydrolase [Allosphingosinicella sp.]